MFLTGAVQKFPCAFLRMGMLFLLADEIAIGIIAVLCMLVFFLRAGFNVPVTLIGVLVIFTATVCLGFLGNGRQDEGIGGAEHNDAGQNADDPFPGPAGQQFSLSHTFTFLFHASQLTERPYGVDKFSHDLFGGHGTHGFVPGIHGDTAMVPHDKPAAVRDLIGQVYVGVAIGEFIYIGFVQYGAVDRDGAVL
ncbi:hypothetical protein BO223_10355 [Faecalibaculum rodentium]|uniref:Uncharacterized protein n=1 Tax=Faecalibaculum rodentium TaxID=1702221 RepID=A0A1Q9YHY4_9FIRM|nr:hypothetical protein BO223_10355 [Faecalibaculum rodentium]